MSCIRVESRRRSRRRCTMICATTHILLFTCCTHLLLIIAAASASSSSTNSTSNYSGAGAGNSRAPLAPHIEQPRVTGPAGAGAGADEDEDDEDDDMHHRHVHKLMSEQDLRRTFQVDSHDQVPEYEILKLSVNSQEISDQRLLRSQRQQQQQHQSPQDKQEAPSVTFQAPASNPSSPEASSGADGLQNNDNNLNEIVMKMSTFGKDFKLRLKRNVDFQKRIKDMKMFMAESTKDGRLRYTEMMEPTKQRRQKEDHSADSSHSPLASPTSQASQAPTSTSAPEAKATGASNVLFPHIDSTYHDEDNLAALLIHHDRKTGQLQVDGTIGNDFVIKPMPQATIDALLLKRQQELLKNQELAVAKTVAAEQLAAASRLDRLAGGDGNNAIGATDGRKPRPEAAAALPAAPNSTGASGKTEPVNLERAMHMHDDDPHDDDEMFLDEDEAIEMAHLQSIESNQTATSNRLAPLAPAASLARASFNGSEPLGQQQASSPRPSQLLPQQRSLSPERKWKKYRKLMARTQVPKPAALQPPPASSSAAERARRHAPQVQVSHHIVYRQRPSSEGSPEHRDSFMVSPGELGRQSAASMEQLAFSFAPQRLQKREAAARDNMIDADEFGHEHLDSQFYLEPGSLTGVERAGHSDWSLINGHRFSPAPPYALGQSQAPDYNGTSHAHSNTTSPRHARFRRHLAGRMPRPAGSQVRKKRQAPDTVWPEVLLVVDYDSFLLHGGDSRDVKRYFVSFWNGVDLRYKLLVHPHIRISLAGMIVAKDRDATPYLERNRLRAPNADAVDAAGALTDMGKYLYREDRLPTYDLAVVITKLDMCRRRYEGGRCNRGTAGFAYVGGACVVNKRLEKVNSVAIIEDSGGFSGIIVAAHEVGHLLGCVHDGSPPPSYLGGPGATHCPWEEGYIMSDLRHTERGFRWSQCSVEQFKHFLNGETATCLYNYPHESQMLHRLLPGTMLSLDEQCKRDRGTNACFKDARVCAQLFCFDSASGYCVSYRPAAEGSPCGEGQVCRNGKCVGEIENIIPDYTHQSQTVVARRPAGHISGGSTGPRLADNGLSASSTSTATSSPNSKLPAISAAQLTSRMDTFPIDTPLSGPAATYPAAAAHQVSNSATTGAYSFGGRYNNGLNEAKSSPTAGIASNGLVLKRQGGSGTSAALSSLPTTASGLHQHHNLHQHHSNNNQHHHHSTMKSAKLLSPVPDYTVTHQMRQRV